MKVGGQEHKERGDKVPSGWREGGREGGGRRHRGEEEDREG